MVSTPDADDHDLAARLVRTAGDLAARLRRAGELDVRHKSSVSDIVTAADQEAERLIQGELIRLRPEDGIVGEEGTRRPGLRTWHVDPVDGTYNYASGLSDWCSALALVDDVGPVLGAVYQPVTDELWLGGRNRATTRNGVELPRLEDARLADVSVATYLHPRTLPDDATRVPLLRAIQPAATIRMLGSGSVELAAVAAGRIGAYLQHNSLSWDWLPGSTLVAAAGGRVEQFEAAGVRWHVAGRPSAVAELIELLVG
ncbi:MAG: inositol monophosphatase family protein [Actinobacteria bacterium]|nr:inositol monophosphatase family protein [Actinomycetota bacterium]